LEGCAPPGQTGRTVILELINTGSELLLGRTLNTHQQWLCRQLADQGYVVARQVAVADTGPDIEGAVREALGRADCVITTGGLGPTSDDLTRERIANLLHRPLHEDPAVLASLQQFFAVRHRSLPARTRVQALVPEGARVLPNAQGTAPGLWLELHPNPCRSGGGPAWLVLLPGPPRELRPMFRDQVLPALRAASPPDPTFQCRTLRVTGLGESQVEEQIDGPLQPLREAGMELGYCARPGEVEVRLVGRGPGSVNQIEAAETIVRARLGEAIFGGADDDLAQVVVRRLTERGQTLAVAESCTGGLLAHRLTNVPGSSAVFLGGLISYSNEAKHRLLGVDPETIARHGAVSEPTARAMAEGARQRLGADYALGITGIAGPGGGTPAKPAGTAFIALASAAPTLVLPLCQPLDRETFKFVTTQQALDLLRRSLLRASA
jgi:nicotinamide-nucleotide amidase